MDKIYIAQSWLGELSTAPWGVIKFNAGKFSLNKKAWADKLQPGANAGANVCRALSFSLFGNQQHATVFQPFKLNGVLWDLASYNDYYFEIMREAIEVAKSLGVKLWVELFDHCGLWTGEGESVKYLNPWANNIQGYGDFYQPSEYLTQYVNKMLTEFGDTVLWGLGNELTDHVAVVSILPVFKAKGIVPFSYGADLDIPGEMASNSVRKMQAMAVEGIWSENEKVQLFHCCHKACEWTDERVFKPVQWWMYHSIAFSDDGAFPRPDGVQWADTIAFVLANQNIEVPQYGQAGKARLLFEHCPEAEGSEAVIAAMVAACEAHGATFANKGNIMPWTDPVEPPKPDPIPEPDKQGITWQGWAGLILLCAVLVALAIFIF